MGTDIHFFMDKAVTAEDGTVKREPVTPIKYDGNRHYYLFAWLADVRNGYGFAGCDMGDTITPIVHPSRGLPDDVKQRLAEQGEEDFLDGEWLGDHSYQWLTSTEILEAAKAISPIKKRGVISVKAWLEWDKVTPLESYSGGRFGGGQYTLNQADVTPEVVKGFKYALTIESELRQSQSKNEWTYRYSKETVSQSGIYSSYRIWNPFTGHVDLGSEIKDPVERWVAKRVLKRRKSVLKHQRKLARYSKRVGVPNIRAEWEMPHEALYEEFKYFIDEIQALHDQHGEFRMVMGFDS